MTIGTLKEGPLHLALKNLYSSNSGKVEVPIGNYIVDVLANDVIYEIQTGSFSGLSKKLSFLLSRQERVRAMLLLVMTLLMALIEMLGIASILPFIAVLTNPEVIDTNIILSNVYQTVKIFGIETKQQFLFVLGFFVFILLIFSISFKVLTIFIQVRFIKLCEYNIAMRLLKRYLYQSYSWF